MTGREDRINLGYRFLCLTWKHTYVGSGTVYHDAPAGRRAGSDHEEQLAGIGKLRRARSERVRGPKASRFTRPGRAG